MNPITLLRALALWYALSLDGTHEKSPNWGPEVQEFLEAAGIDTAAPWCAAFVNFVFQKMAELIGTTSPLEAVPLQAYVQSYVDHARKHGWVVSFKDAQPGDLFAIYFPALKRCGHMGILVCKQDAQAFVTIEGNTNLEGEREGDRVRSKTRINTDNILFFRPA